MTYEELLRSAMLKAVLENQNSLIRIGISDVEELFRQDEDIRAFDVRVSSIGEQRMERVMKKMKEEADSSLSFSSALIFFLFPESHPLLMSEIQPLSEWIESAPGEFLLTWGMTTQSSQELRIIILVL